MSGYFLSCHDIAMSRDVIVCHVMSWPFPGFNRASSKLEIAPPVGNNKLDACGMWLVLRGFFQEIHAACSWPQVAQVLYASDLWVASTCIKLLGPIPREWLGNDGPFPCRPGKSGVTRKRRWEWTIGSLIVSHHFFTFQDQLKSVENSRLVRFDLLSFVVCTRVSMEVSS